MQYKVPQFIDIEDKIFGPFTFKELLYLAGGSGLHFVFYRLLPLILAIIPMAISAGLAGALVFYKPNGRPFAKQLESWFQYIFKGKLYLWKKEPKRQMQKTEKSKKDEPAPYAPKLSGSQLKDIAWSLDVLDLDKRK